MTSQELLTDVDTRLTALTTRLEAAFGKLSDTEMNAPIPPSNWSPAQIVEHLMLTNAPYLSAVPAVLTNAAKGGDQPAVFTWFGKFLMNAGGPGGNAPAPKALHPTPGPKDRSILTANEAQAKEFAALRAQMVGLDLGRTRVNNPFMKIFRMTLADFLQVSALHTERHIAQIEAALPKG